MAAGLAFGYYTGIMFWAIVECLTLLYLASYLLNFPNYSQSDLVTVIGLISFTCFYGLGGAIALGAGRPVPGLGGRKCQ